MPEGSVSAVTSSITRLGDDLVEVQGRRIAREAALKQIEQARGSRQSLETVPQVAVDSLALSLSGQLATLQLDLSRLKEKFKDAHPEVQKVQAQIEQLKKALADTGKVTAVNFWQDPAWPDLGDRWGIILEELITGSRTDIQGGLDELDAYAKQLIARRKK